jgi:hypothetical protein
MSNGKDYKLFLSSAGTAATPLVEIEYQGDLTINTGKTNERTAFKNGSVTAQGNSGWMATCSIGLREPMPAGQDIIFDHSDAGTSVFMAVKAATGTLMYSGVVKIAVTEIPNPVSGVRVATIDLSEDGVITRGVAA